MGWPKALFAESQIVFRELSLSTTTDVYVHRADTDRRVKNNELKTEGD